jgi:hypothetical protein
LRYVLICGLLSGVALVSWLLAGRRLVTLLDGVTLAVVDQPGVERLVYDGGVLELGGKHVDLMTPAFVRVAEVSLGAEGRVALESGGRQFPLGPGRSIPYIGTLRKVEFTRDAGDDVLFTVEQSRIAWHTPFEMNFMTGSAPSRKRNVYLRLRWIKRQGARMEMRWKTEQSYYREDGWSPPRIETVLDGLVHVNIREADKPE